MVRQASLGGGRQTRHPGRVRKLVEIRRPETVCELMKFLNATNWIRLSLPHMAEIVVPLRALMEHRLKGTSRTKSVASRRALTYDDWTPEWVDAWDNSREMTMNAVEMSLRRPDDCRVLMFPDASDLYWGHCLTQVPKEELLERLSFMDLSHEPLAFLSGAFRGQGTLRNSECFAARAVLAVGWLEHFLRLSQLGVHRQPAIVWRDVRQGCVAMLRRVVCMHEPVQLCDPAHLRGG